MLDWKSKQLLEWLLRSLKVIDSGDASCHDLLLVVYSLLCILPCTI